MALIPATTVAEIRDRTDIVAIVAEHVPLRRSGTNHQGLCPFHQEKSPSFTVSAVKQFFYCFGCQKSGDVFRFLMDLTGRTFVEVAQELAGRAGVTIPEPEPYQRGGRSSRPSDERERSAQQDERARLLRLNELSARFFEAELKRSDAAQRYLDERGVSPELVTRFRLGYAPNSWDGLLRVFTERKVPHELAELAGLLIRREGSAALPVRAPATSSTHYDRFRDRIIFPLLTAGVSGKVQTTLGDVVAFGGRVLPGAQEAPGAKYINSPETPLYKKGDHLFGLHSARDPIRKQRQVILVEGNFDVIALQQYGFENTVAPMGTALTETQVRLLSRLIGEDGHVVLMLDGDRAGRSATLKDIFLFTEANLRDLALLSGRDIDVRVARLPDGEDPDTFARRDAAGLSQAIRAAQPAIDYVLDETIVQAKAEESVSGRAKTIEKVVPLLAAIRNRTAQEMHIRRVATSLGESSEFLWRRISSIGAPGQGSGQGPGQGSRFDDRRAAPPAAPQRTSADRPPAPKAARFVSSAAEQDLISLVADHPRLLPLLDEDLLDRLENPVLSELLRQAREEEATGSALSVEKILALCPEEAQPHVAQAALSGKFLHLEHPEQKLFHLNQQIRGRAIQREVSDLTQQLHRSQRSSDPAARQSITQRISELIQLRTEILAMNGQMEKDQAPQDPSTGLVAGENPR